MLRLAAMIGPIAIAFPVGGAILGWQLTGHKKADLAAWIEASATLFAFMAAGVAVIFAASAYLIEHRREERWQDAQLREQASLIAAWPGRRVEPMEVISSRPGGGTDPTNIGWSAREGVLIRNASQVPVTAVAAVALGSDGQSSIAIVRRQVVPPDSEPQFFQWDEPGRDRIDRARLEAGGDEEWFADVTLYFTDARGRSWQRTSVGWLHERDFNDLPPQPRDEA
jgi:hypothetical protein